MYCSLEEAWGSDFGKEGKGKDKKKKKREYENPQRGDDKRFKPVLNNLEIDKDILIEPPRTWKSANSLEKEPPLIQPFDYYSSNERNLDYVPYSTNIYPNVQQQQQQQSEYRQPLSRVNETPSLQQKDGYVQVPLSEYQKLIQEKEQQIRKNLTTGTIIEGFSSNDEQFNELLLYIFTGIFLLISHDLMFQLGKRSY
jgi:hypothetical protein